MARSGTLRWEEQPCVAVLDLAKGSLQFYDLTPFTNTITPAELLLPIG